MSWIKNAIVDIGITILIAAMVLTNLNWIYWVLVIYTGFMVLIKVVGLIGPAIKSKVTDDTPPNWFYHLLYALNVALLAMGQHVYLLAGWAVIWLLSIVYQRKRS